MTRQSTTTGITGSSELALCFNPACFSTHDNDLTSITARGVFKMGRMMGKVKSSKAQKLRTETPVGKEGEKGRCKAIRT